MSTLCGCGHDMERHNDDDTGIMSGSYAGNCRMCKCEEFVKQESGTVPGGMTRCSKHDFIHISDWGCPFCYVKIFNKKREENRLGGKIPPAYRYPKKNDMIAALKKHGDHTQQCQVIQQGRYYMQPLECDCGWDEIVKEYL